jgi:hypothetical protein
MSDHSMKYQRDEARAEAERALASVRDLAEQVAELSARALAAEKERDETRRQLDKFMSSTAAHNIRAMKAESALSEALAALRSIAEGASGYRAGGGYFCDWCGENGHEGHAKQHPKRCPRTAARAVLDKLGVSDG